MEVRCANRRKGARQFEDMAHNGSIQWTSVLLLPSTYWNRVTALCWAHETPADYPGNERGIVCAIDKYLEDGSEVSIGVCRNREAAGVVAAEF